MLVNVKYKSSKGTGSFFDVLPDKLTFQMAPSIYSPNQSATIFKELTPVVETKKSTVRPHITDKHWPKIVFSKLVETIDRLWDDSVPHVVSHSSGYDSRVISMALKELGKEAIFLEMHCEGEGFKKIMQYFGWKNYLIYPYQRVYEIPFSEIWKHYNAPVGYPFNIFYKAVQDFINEGLLPGNARYITGVGQNESTRSLGKGSLQNYYNFITCRASNNFKMVNTFIAPFNDHQFLETRAKYHTGPRMTYDMITCEKLKAITNETVVTRYENIDQQVKDFANSRVGKKIKTIPDKKIIYSHWWGTYVAASFVEQIKNKEIIL